MRSIRVLTIATLLASVSPVTAQGGAESLDPPPEAPALGFRFGGLTPAQRAALRPRFKLPMDALFAARTPRDVVKAAVIQPLPDPSRPLLAATPAGTGGDPFAEAAEPESVFSVLEALFAADEAFSAEAARAPAPPAAEEQDAFGGGFDDDFTAVEASPEDASDAAEDDFADDPFADFE